MKSNKNDLIDPADFETFHIEVSLMNCTTNSEIRNDMRFVEEHKEAKFSVDSETEKLSIRIVQLLDDGMILSVPARSCATGHKIVLHLEVSGVEIPTKFSTLAAVKRSKNIGKARSQITVKFNKFDKIIWQYIKDLYNDRQLEVMNFLKAAKGA